MFFYPDSLSFSVQKYNFLRSSGTSRSSRISRQDFIIIIIAVFITVRVENFEVVLISRFSWVADDTKIIHVEGGINTREIF